MNVNSKNGGKIMKKISVVLVVFILFIFSGCSQNGEYMPQIKNQTNIFELYSCQDKQLVKEFKIDSDSNQLLILDSIVNNADNSKDYSEELSETEPEYILIYCGESSETSVYIKIRFSDGKVFREIYSENEASLSLDQGILECITVTEEEFKELLN